MGLLVQAPNGNVPHSFLLLYIPWMLLVAFTRHDHSNVVRHFHLFGNRLHTRTCQGRCGIGYPTPRRSILYVSIVFFLHVNKWWPLLNMAAAETLLSVSMRNQE